MAFPTTKNLGGHPTAERAAAIKADVVAATLQAFAEHGGDFRMDEVAKIAGVSTQAIYRRWRSKIDLVVEAIDTVIDDGLGHAGELPADPVAALRAVAWHVFCRDQTASNRLSIYLQVESFQNDRLRQRLADWRIRFISLYTRHLLAIDVAGRRAAGDLEVQAELLMELLAGGSMKLAMSGTVSPEDERRCFEQRWDAFRLIAIR